MFKSLARLVVTALAVVMLLPMALGAQEGRKVKKEVTPVYPEVAREMHVAGSVKLEVTIAPSGKVKAAKVIGGHPVLIQSALDAVKQFQYAPATEETTAVVVFNFGQ
jgi:TonB family protein